MAFGNVNVDYKPCKSVGQLKSAEKYMLGKRHDQIKSGVVKTAPDLYSALGCSRDNFANNVLVTRKLHGKSYGGKSQGRGFPATAQAQSRRDVAPKSKHDDVLAHKMSISFHPEDRRASGGKLTYHIAYDIAKQFAEKFVAEKGHEVLFVVHTDSKHIHVHFLISNCNIHTGKAYRRNKKDLREMSKFFGEQCLELGLENSVREEFYKKDLEQKRDKITLAERKMAERNAESFKEELREVIREEILNPANKNFDDVINALWKNWNVECRVAGNTVSYRYPEYRNKNNELVSVRGSKLGELYTRKGIENELNKKSREITYAECGIGQNLDNDSVNAGTQFTGLRGQTQSDIDVRDDESNLRSINSFYDRYKKRVEDVEQSAIADIELAERVRSKSKGRSR
jgi:hypothetical protein